MQGLLALVTRVLHVRTSMFRYGFTSQRSCVSTASSRISRTQLAVFGKIRITRMRRRNSPLKRSSMFGDFEVHVDFHLSRRLLDPLHAPRPFLGQIAHLSVQRPQPRNGIARTERAA